MAGALAARCALAMRRLKGEPFDRWRDTSERTLAYYGGPGDDTCGAFLLPRGLFVIASVGEGWDHVSVSRKDRCPSWEEMVFVKRSFFCDDEWAMELHPPKASNISVHPYCLHLWRPIGTDIPLPPESTVA